MPISADESDRLTVTPDQIVEQPIQDNNADKANREQSVELNSLEEADSANPVDNAILATSSGSVIAESSNDAVNTIPSSDDVNTEGTDPVQTKESGEIESEVDNKVSQSDTEENKKTDSDEPNADEIVTEESNKSVDVSKEDQDQQDDITNDSGQDEPVKSVQEELLEEELENSKKLKNNIENITLSIEEFTNATPIEESGTYIGSIDSEQEWNLYSFYLETASEVSINLSSDNNQAICEVYDSQQTLLETPSQFDNNTGGTLSLDAGEYFVKVSCISPTEYTLSYLHNSCSDRYPDATETDHGFIIDGAVSLIPNQWYCDILTLNALEAWFSFATTGNCTFCFESDNTVLDYALFDENQNQLYGETIDSNGQFDWELPEGKYFLQLKGRKDNAGAFSFCIEHELLNGWSKGEDGFWHYYVDDVKSTGWISYNNGMFYLGPDGNMRTGWQSIDGTYYYFKPGNSGRMLTGWQYIKNNWFFLGDDGKMRLGWQSIDGHTFYFKEKNNSGRLLTGWQEIDGVYYYFAPGNTTGMLTGWQKINGNWFYLGDDGKMRTGWQIINGNKFYFKPENNSGRMLTGWQKIDGVWYYFKPGDSGRMLTGWQKINNYWFYLGSDGKMRTGWQKIGGEYYYFRGGDSGRMLTGWQTIGSGTFYLGSNGKMRRDWQKIDGKWYCFKGGNSGRMRTGWYTVKGTDIYNYPDRAGNTYYFDLKTGVMATGSKTIDGKKYYFDPQTGAYDKNTDIIIASAPEGSINVMDYGASGKGNQDDTSYIQKAIDDAPEGSTVYIPAGTYNIKISQTNAFGTYTGIDLKSNINLIMDRGAVLKVQPTSIYEYDVISFNNVKNTNVIGGVIQGERTSHQGTKGEGGHGVGLYNSSNVTVSYLNVYNNWGDGFYIGTHTPYSSRNNVEQYGCDKITIRSCEVANNRRTNISIVKASNLDIDKCTLRYTLKSSEGTSPRSGINIEPNYVTVNGKKTIPSDLMCKNVSVKNTSITTTTEGSWHERNGFLTIYNPNDSSYISTDKLLVRNCKIDADCWNASATNCTMKDNTISGTLYYRSATSLSNNKSSTNYRLPF